jgi:crotonobetainyl-CoA:carnitine CoA-transferase CaiB-like acyl-CoA transferase
MDPVPALGEHADAILGELGYSPGQIAELYEDQVV